MQAMCEGWDEQDLIKLPYYYLHALGLQNGDEIEIQIAENCVIIQKAILGCIFCGAAATLVRIGEYAVCEVCRKRLASAKNGDYLYSIRVE